MTEEELALKCDLERRIAQDRNKDEVAQIAVNRGITLGHLRNDGGNELHCIMVRLNKAEQDRNRLLAEIHCGGTTYANESWTQKAFDEALVKLADLKEIKLMYESCSK